MYSTLGYEGEVLGVENLLLSQTASHHPHLQSLIPFVFYIRSEAWELALSDQVLKYLTHVLGRKLPRLDGHLTSSGSSGRQNLLLPSRSTPAPQTTTEGSTDVKLQLRPSISMAAVVPKMC